MLRFDRLLAVSLVCFLGCDPKEKDAPPPAKEGAEAKAEATPPESAATPQAALPTGSDVAMTGVQSFAPVAGVKAHGFYAVYVPSKDPVGEKYRKFFQDKQLFDRLASSLSAFDVDRTVPIQITDCGRVNAFYDPRAKRIIMCNELSAYFDKMFTQVEPDDGKRMKLVTGAVFFTFYHEVGHALIDLLELPAVGMQEDAADQLASSILMGAKKGDMAHETTLAAAQWFELESKASKHLAFWDEHSLNQQRYFNVLCWLYGSNPSKYGPLLTGKLPESRMKRCPAEWASLEKSWRKLLAPHSAKPNQTAEPSEACKKVALHAVDVLVNEIKAKAKGASPEETKAVQAQTKKMIPGFARDIAAKCESGMSEKSRSCVVAAKTVPELKRC